MTIAALVTLLFSPAADAKRHPGKNAGRAHGRVHIQPRHSRGYLAAVQLNRALLRTPMRGTGWGLVNEARSYGLNPALIAAIAGTESTYGAAACRSNRFNAYGLSSCGTGWRVPAFRSWRESYRFMARFLSSRWPGARTPYDFHGYALCDACWGRKTSQHMLELGFPATVGWPA